GLWHCRLDRSRTHGRRDRDTREETENYREPSRLGPSDHDRSMRAHRGILTRWETCRLFWERPSVQCTVTVAVAREPGARFTSARENTRAGDTVSDAPGARSGVSCTGAIVCPFV